MVEGNPSSASSASPTLDSTQLPTPSFNSKLQNSIPEKEVQRLINTYNRQPVPIFEDERFCKWLYDSGSVATSGQVDELGIARWIRGKSSRMEDDLLSMRMALLEMALTQPVSADEQEPHLIDGLRGTTVYGFLCILKCLCLTAWQAPHSKRQKRAHVKRERPVNQPPNQLRHIIEVKGPRRSERIAHQHPRRSGRIDKRRKLV